MNTRAYLRPNWHQDNYRLVIIQDIDRGKIRVASDFKWQEFEEGLAFEPDEGIPAANDLVQAILNEAWRVGMRPHGFADVQNETTAIKAHLDDMRTVAFHKLGIAK